MAKIKFTDIDGTTHCDRVEDVRVEVVKDVISKQTSYIANNGYENEISEDVYNALKAEGCREL